ncbi:MAG: hypothetical protein ABI592_05715 [Acidobacteriota bacterium]
MNSTFAGVLALSAAIGVAVPAAAAESRMEKALRLEPGGQFTLKTDLGSVRLTGVDRSGARLVITSKRGDLADLLHFRFDEETGAATVVARRKHPISSFFSNNGNSVHFEIEVPTATRVNVDSSGGSITTAALRGNVKLDTSGGAIAVGDQTGDVFASTSGGSIALSHVKGKSHVETSGGGINGDAIDGPIDADTSGGSIELDAVTGDIKAHSSGGGISIREAGGRVEADTSGGSVQVAFAHANGRGGSIESSGGGVSVSLDPTVGLSIDASGDSVHSDVPITVRGELSRSHMNGVLGAGGPTLRLRTSGGSVHIRAL